MSPTNDGRATVLIASVALHFLKSTILQRQIDEGALSETKHAYGRLVALAKKRVDEHVLERAAKNNRSNTRVRVTAKKLEMNMCLKIVQWSVIPKETSSTYMKVRM